MKMAFTHAVFRLAQYLEHSNGSYKWLQQKQARSCMLLSYLFLCVTHLQQSQLSHFTCNTLIEAAILFLGHSYIPINLLAWLVIICQSVFTFFWHDLLTCYGMVTI